MLKKILAGTLGVSMVLTSLAADGFSKLNANKNAETHTDESQSRTDTELVGSNSLGKMIAKTENEAKEEPGIRPLGNTNDEGTYSVYDVDFDIETGQVTVRSSQTFACNLQVSIIDENDNTNQINHTLQAQMGELVTTVGTIDTQELPEYFTVRAVLVNKGGNELCEAQLCKKYTQLYQEAAAATVNDFEEEYVVNLDESEETNFFVLNEETVIAESTEENNVLISADYDKDEYSFSNIDDSIRSLKKGDMFFANPDNINIVAINVSDIKIDGDKATIIGDGQSEDIFDFVKIEATEDSEQKLDITEVNTDYAEYEGVTVNEEGNDEYTFRIGDTPEILEKNVDEVKIDAEIMKSTMVKDLALLKGNNYGITGTFTLNLPNVKVTYYKKLKDSSIEFEVSCGAKLELKINASLKAEIPLAHVEVPTTIFGLEVGIEPTITFKAEASISLEYSVKPSCKASIDPKNGFQYTTALENKDKEKTLTYDIKGKVEVGFDLRPTLFVVRGAVAKISIKLIVGYEIVPFDVKLTEYPNDIDATEFKSLSGSLFETILDERIHKCGLKCMHYKASAYLQLGVKIEAFISSLDYNLDIVKVTLDLGVAHCSWASDKLDFGWGECQNMMYRTTLAFLPSTKEIGKVEIDSNEYTLNGDREVILYCDPGSHECKIYDTAGKQIISKRFTVGRKASLIVIDPDDTSSTANTIPKGEITTTTVPEPTFPATTTVATNEVQAMRQCIANGGLDPLHLKKSDNSIFDVVEGKTSSGETDYKLVLDDELPESAIYYDLFADGTLHIYGYGEVNDFGSSPFSNDVKKNVKEVYIENLDPENGLVITSLGKHLFDGCSNLRVAVIPDTITSIGESTFSGCENLITITYKNPYEIIKDANGKEKTVLREVFELPESIETIRDDAFTCCENLAIGDYVSGSKLKSIGYKAFEDCQKLITAHITGNVKTIGNSAFSDCYNLKSLYLEKGVESLGKYSLARCISLEKVTLPFASRDVDGLKTGYSRDNAFISLFQNSKDSNYVAEDSEKQQEINEKLYASSFPQTSNDPIRYIPTSLETIEILGGERIPENAFYDLSKVKRIILPDEIVSIESKAFFGCKSLELGDLVIGNNIKIIGSYVFADCKGLKSVVIPESVEEMGSYIFKDCTELKTATIKGNFTDEARCIELFDGCTSLEELTLPYAAIGKKYLEPNSLGHDNQLLSLFGKTNEAGTYYALFDGNNILGRFVPESLKTIKILGGERIPKIAFKNLKSIETVCIPGTVEEICDNAFNNCPNITTIYYNGTKSQWDEKVKDNIGNGNDVVTECYNEENGRKIVYLGDTAVTEGPLYGDANCDGKVTLSDALAVLQFVANEDKYPLTEEGQKNADCVDAGKGITAQDALAIQMVDTELIDISELPIAASALNR